MGRDREACRKELTPKPVKCPACGEDSYYTFEFEKEVVGAARVLVYGGVCRSCGYKSYETLEIDSKPPIKIVVEVDSIDALNSLVYKGKRATIKIPELGVEVYPATHSDPYITTVEGVLYRVLEVLESCNESLECKVKRELVEKAIEGKLSFTLIIEDPGGTSKFIPKNPDKVKYKVSRLKV